MNTSDPTPRFSPRHFVGCSSLTAMGLIPLGALICISCAQPSNRTFYAAPTVPSGPASVIDVRYVHRPLGAAEAVDYVGNGACVVCHGKIARRHALSRHARTFRPVTLAEFANEFALTPTLIDKHKGLRYTTSIANGKCLMIGSSAEGGGAVSADYAMGAGKTGHTFFHIVEPGTWLDLRISYYTRRKCWDFGPMQRPEDDPQSAIGRLHSGDGLSKCLLCHVTVLRQTNGQIDIEHSTLGVGCERCHGPGRAHVAAARRPYVTVKDVRQSIDGLSRVAPEALNRICGECHRTAETVGKGDSHLEDDLARFQGAALARSRCFLESRTLSCTSCHESHANASPSPEHYDAICIQCHGSSRPQPHLSTRPDQPRISAVARRICPVNPRTGCTHCHMPRQTINTLNHASFANHWIKIWKRK